VSPTEVANRVAKATKIADVLAAHGCTKTVALVLPESGWSMAAELAGTQFPSSSTQACVVAALAERERADAFEGLPS
jgi:hypothetical protein